MESCLYCFASTSSAKSPCHLGSLADLVNSIFWEVSITNCVSLMHLSQDVTNLSQENCVRVQALLHLRNYLRTPPTNSGRSRKRSSEDPLLSLFWFLFWVFGGSRDEFPGPSSSLRSDAGLGGVLDDVLDESGGGDVEDELVPELGRQSRDNKTYAITFFASIFLSLFGRPWLFTVGPLVGISVFFAKFSKW